MNYLVNGIRFSQDGQDTDVEVNQGGVDCIYKRKTVPFSKPVRYVRMDLDGTSVKSEEFWIRRIQETIGKVSHHPDFTLSEDDLPYVSGFTTAEHLSYCLEKYKIPVSRNDALKVYHALTKERLERIRSGKEKTDAFQPREGLKEFLFCLKNKEIQIGLATSGLDYKAIGEIESAFSLLGLGKPTDFMTPSSLAESRKKKEAMALFLKGQASLIHGFMPSLHSDSQSRTKARLLSLRILLPESSRLEQQALMLSGSKTETSMLPD